MSLTVRMTQVIISTIVKVLIRLIAVPLCSHFDCKRLTISGKIKLLYYYFILILLYFQTTCVLLFDMFRYVSKSVNLHSEVHRVVIGITLCPSAITNQQ